MQKVFLIFLLVISINSYSQQIDSLNLLSQNSLPSIHIYGKLNHTGFSIVKIESLISDTVSITMYFKECSGFQVISDFDTTLIYSNSWPVVPEEIQVLSILDTNTVDSSCILINQFDTLSIFNYSSQLLAISEKDIGKSINIFPIPAKDVLQIEVNDDIQFESIELFDMSGQKIKTFNASDRNLNISSLGIGAYFLKLSTSDGEVTKKVIIE